MNFEEAGACGINKRRFEISMTDDEKSQYDAFLEWMKGAGNSPDGLSIPWEDEKKNDEFITEQSEDLFIPMFKTLDTVCDDIPDDAEFKPVVEELTDEMAAYFES